MTDQTSLRPETCTTMTELREGIDALDAQIIALLAARMRFIDRAAQIKSAAGLPANIPARVDEVVAKVRAEAGANDLSADLIEKMWREMIDWSIAREEETLGPSPRTESSEGSAT